MIVGGLELLSPLRAGQGGGILVTPIHFAISWEGEERKLLTSRHGCTKWEKTDEWGSLPATPRLSI